MHAVAVRVIEPEAIDHEILDVAEMDGKRPAFTDGVVAPDGSTSGPSTEYGSARGGIPSRCFSSRVH
jgi:hypothetical protein